MYSFTCTVFKIISPVDLTNIISQNQVTPCICDPEALLQSAAGELTDMR